MKNFKRYIEEHYKIKLIEIGAGVPVTNHILKQKDSSKVLVESICPYGTAKKLYKISDDTRMVSKEAVHQILKETIKRDYSEGTFDYTLVFISSFQIPTESYSDKIPHGWICIADLREDIKYTFHVTLREKTSSDLKKYFINIYKDVALKLLDYVCFKESIESIYDVDSIEINEKGTIKEDSYKELMKQEEMLLVFSEENGKITTKRFEDLVRPCQNVLIYKGSFNPIHDGHKEILNRSLKSITEGRTLSLLTISKNTFGKGNVEKLEERIENLCKQGYKVLLIETPWFFDTLDLIRSRFKGNLYSCMGMDTLKRLYECYMSCNFSDLEASNVYGKDPLDKLKNMIMNFKVTFKVFDRPNVDVNKEIFKECGNLIEFFDMNNPISSTELRKGL